MLLGNLKNWMPIFRDAFEKTFIVGNFFCCLHVTNTYICSFALLEGPSMLPTFNLTGALVLAERVSARFGKVDRGDVVCIRSPTEPIKLIAKRVIAVGGDTVSFSTDPDKSDELTTVVIPQGHVWIEGDNKYNSTDSRNFGPVPYGLVEARVLCKVWPFQDIGIVEKKVR